MYYYKFDGDNLTHTLIADAKPEGYIDFGEMVDWTRKRYVGGVLEDIPAPPEPEPYIPTAAEVAAQTEAQLTWAVQNHMDNAARAARFDNLKSVISYRGDTIKPEWAAQAEQFFVWRSKVWAACYAILDDVLAGERLPPTVDELLAELPKMGVE